MNFKNNRIAFKKHLVASALLLAAIAVPAQAINVVYSGTSQAADQAVISLIQGNFSDVNITYGDFSDYATHAATIEAADLFIVGRRLTSGAYANATNSASFNALTVPVVAFTSYVTRPLDSRWGWHGGNEAAGLSVVGSETTVTAAGASIFGVAAGAYDWYPDPNTFNAAGTGSVGDGEILATIGGNILAAHWNAGDLSGTGAIFGSERFLFNLSEIAGPTTTLPNAAGQQALISALEAFTPLAPLSDLWNVNGGGSFNVAGNWSENAVPTQNPVFGSILTGDNAPATVTLDSSVSLNRISFQNPNQYILAGPGTLTLTGSREVVVGSGTHQITADIAGGAGLVKTGPGELILPNATSYTGTTDIQQGALRLGHLNAASNQVNVEAGATLFFEGNGAGGGFNGTFSGNITGAGQVATSTNMTTEVVTINTAQSYSGQTTINGGTLQLSGPGTPGSSDGTFASRTMVAGNANQGKLALTGGVNIANEVLTLGAREGAGLEAIHVSSSGNNSWTGNVKGDVGGTQYNLESTSGTLTLGGTISAPDTGVRNFVFSGAGNFNISGKLVDTQTNDAGVEQPGPINNLNNVNVIKRGSGTLTIGTGTDAFNDFWRGSTVIEGGRMLVTTGGRLYTSGIDVRSGAIFEVQVDPAGYSFQVNQSLAGGGEVLGQGFNFFGDNLISPGDGGPGTLTFRGSGGAGNANVSISSDFGPGGGLAYDLAGTNTVGGGVNDLITGVGNLTLSGSAASPIEVMVSPVSGALASGSYRLIQYGGALNKDGTSDADLFDVTLQGINGPTRQTLAVSTATAGQVNLVVSGSAGNLTWNGTAGNNQWNINSAANWTGTGNTFFQLDKVTFNDSAANKTVNVAENVLPGSVTFNNSSNYQFSGPGGMIGGTSVNLNGTGEVEFGNAGNNYSGPTTVSAGSSLRFSTSATTGGIVNSGKLSVGSVSVTAGSPVSVVNAGFEADAAPVLGATGWTITSGGTDWFTTTAGAPDSVVDPLAAAEGVNWLSGNRLVTAAAASSNPQTLTQLIDISAQSTLIDAGTAHVKLDFQFADVDPLDDGTVNITFFSNVAGTTPIGTALSTGILPETGTDGSTARALWDAQSLTGAVPATARSFRIEIVNNRTGGTAGNTHYDDLSAAIKEGAFAGPAVLDVTGGLTLVDGSELEFVIESASSFSQLNLDGLLSANGELNIVALPTAILSAGDVFDILDFGSVAGAFDNFVLPSLTAGLAWDTSSLLTTGEISVVVGGTPGDFDGDGDVDGRDFLVWQRGGSPNPLSASDLADWQANYGAQASAASTAVPEPASCLLGGALLLLGMLGRFHLRQESTIVTF